MFFFFVGGVNQQVRQVLKFGAGRCIRCGSRADLVEYEKVLKLFFVPVWKCPGKYPAMYCINCNLFFPPAVSETLQKSLPPSDLSDELRCRFCQPFVVLLDRIYGTLKRMQEQKDGEKKKKIQRDADNTQKQRK